MNYQCFIASAMYGLLKTAGSTPQRLAERVDVLTTPTTVRSFEQPLALYAARDIMLQSNDIGLWRRAADAKTSLN